MHAKDKTIVVTGGATHHRGHGKNKARVPVGPDSKFLDLLYRFNSTFAAAFISKQMKKHLQIK